VKSDEKKAADTIASSIASVDDGLSNVMKYMSANITSIVNDSSWLKLSASSLHRILCWDTLAAEEIILYRAALKWARAHSDAKETDTPTTLRTALGDIFNCIRFPLMVPFHTSRPFIRRVV
jgi:hypothetical protein